MVILKSMGIDCRDEEVYWYTVTTRCGPMYGLFVENLATILRKRTRQKNYPLANPEQQSKSLDREQSRTLLLKI